VALYSGNDHGTCLACTANTDVLPSPEQSSCAKDLGVQGCPTCGYWGGPFHGVHASCYNLWVGDSTSCLGDPCFEHILSMLFMACVAELGPSLYQAQQAPLPRVTVKRTLPL
jgi:hypothetical protein